MQMFTTTTHVPVTSEGFHVVLRVAKFIILVTKGDDFQGFCPVWVTRRLLYAKCAPSVQGCGCRTRKMKNKAIVDIRLRPRYAIPLPLRGR